MAILFSKAALATGRSLGLVGLVALGAAWISGIALADEKPVPPPYLAAGTNHVIVGVVWDAAAIRTALPSWVTPVEGMTGAINIYQAERGYGLTPYQSAYFWVDVEGFDSPSGVKGRWMLQGVYGPQEKTSVAMKEFEGFPVRNGTSRFEATAEGKRAIGSVNGQDFVTVEIKSVPGSCEPGSVTLNYPTRKGLIEIPAAGDVCKAEPVSVEVSAPSGDPFAAFKPVKTLWAIEFKNGAFAIPRPQPLGQ